MRRTVLFWSLLCAAPCFSQSLCTLDDSLDVCERKFREQAKEQSEKASAEDSSAKADQDKKLSQVNTGIATALSALPTSSVNDFFSTLKIGAATEGSDSDDDAWAIEINKCSPARRQPRSVQCQIRVRTGDASLFEPLKQALPESTRATRAEELERGIGDFDAATIGFFINLNNRKLGRQLQYASDPLYQAVFDLASTQSEESLTKARVDLGGVYAFLQQEIEDSNRANHQENIRMLVDAGGGNVLEACPPVPPGDLPAEPRPVIEVNDADPEPTKAIGLLWNAFCALQRTDNDHRPDRVEDYAALVKDLRSRAAALGIAADRLRVMENSEENSGVPFKTLRPASAKTALELAESALRRRSDAALSRAQALSQAGFFDLYRLANNQPQVHFGIEARNGSKYAGPSEARARLSWEIGWANLNDLAAFSGPSGRCEKKAATNQEDKRAVCLSEYLADPDVRADLAASDRAALIIEYVRRSSYSAVLTSDNVRLDLPSEKSLVGSFTYGRYLNIGTAPADFGKTRVDIVASYEDVSGDPLRNDRGLATLVLTQELMSGFVLSLSAVYATDPEFRGDANKEWSTRFVVNYKLARRTAD